MQISSQKSFRIVVFVVLFYLFFIPLLLANVEVFMDFVFEKDSLLQTILLFWTLATISIIGILTFPFVEVLSLLNLMSPGSYMDFNIPSPLGVFLVITFYIITLSAIVAFVRNGMREVQKR